MRNVSFLKQHCHAGLAVILLPAAIACSGSGDSTPSGSGGAAGASAGGAAGTAKGGGTSSGGNTSLGGGSPLGGGAGMATGGTGMTTGGSSSTTGGTGVGGATGAATCSEAAKAYTLTTTLLDASLTPAKSSGGKNAELPVTVDPNTGTVYVGFTKAEGTSSAAVIAAAGATPITIPEAVNAGIAATKDGLAVLLFDPTTPSDQRRWAAVKRLRSDGSEVFSTDMFRSPNLDDVGTKGAPGTSRLRYNAATDETIAYFGHTQRYDDGVRHQGGFVGRLSATGTLEVLNGWFGSHNLDQRLLVEGTTVALLGLGDAYPEGIFYGMAAARMRTTVIYPLASAGNGATNGQLGGMVDFGDAILVPFITNRSVPQDLDAGTWPDIDETISSQIRAAAGNGTDLGLLRLPKMGSVPMGGLTATWLDPAKPATARLERLKSARYGTGNLTLLAWAETTGSGRTGTSTYFTMVVDRDGGVCQAKTSLDAKYAPTGGDDIIRAPDGRLIWANLQGTTIQIVTLTPG